MACIFNTVMFGLSAAITDSFEGRGAYSRGGAYWRICGICTCTVCTYVVVHVHFTELPTFGGVVAGFDMIVALPTNLAVGTVHCGVAVGFSFIYATKGRRE